MHCLVSRHGHSAGICVSQLSEQHQFRWPECYTRGDAKINCKFECRRAALAVAVGSIVRSKGGIALQSTLNLTAGTLLAAAQVCPGPAQLWLLHGTWLIVNSAGPAFLPHVTVRPKYDTKSCCMT